MHYYIYIMQYFTHTWDMDLQNKAVQIIGGGNYYYKATLFYSILGILKLLDLVKLEIALFV